MTKEFMKQQVLNAFNARHSVRVYNEQEISKEDMAYILEIARLSPSSVGSEPWRFIVLNRQKITELKAELAPISWGGARQMDTASHFILIIVQKNMRYDSKNLYQSLLNRGLNEEQMTASLALYKRFQEDDITIANSDRAIQDWAEKQTYIALGNMMTAAAMIGIDSCPIEGFHHDNMNKILSDHHIIDLNEESIVTMLSLGYRAKEPTRAKYRKPVDDVITWLS